MTDDPSKKQNDPTQIARAASNRDNNLGNSGTQTTSPKNVLRKEERTRGRTAKNKIRVNSGEHHKSNDRQGPASWCRALLNCISSRCIEEETWQVKA